MRLLLLGMAFFMVAASAVWPQCSCPGKCSLTVRTGRAVVIITREPEDKPKLVFQSLTSPVDCSDSHDPAHCVTLECGPLIPGSVSCFGPDIPRECSRYVVTACGGTPYISEIEKIPCP